MDFKAKINVSELVQYLKRKVDQDIKLSNIKVYGEISNVKKSYNNHLYFDLKDSEAKINCIIFSNNANNIDFTLQDGLKINAYGSVKVYPLSSSFQIIVEKIEKDGLGNLYLEFEKNKKELEKKGYFDIKYKKSIPKFPNKIAVISGNNSAALKDCLTTLNKRYKLSQVFVFPTLVQGNMAASNMIQMINLINKYDFDVILLIRGGGSFEDLNAFNDIELAKIIFNSKTPIVTGIGHEVDYTIADFVADYRALTPTAAAIAISPNKDDILNNLSNSKTNIIKTFNYLLMNNFQNVDTYLYKIEKLFKNNLDLNKKELEFLQNRLETNNISNVILEYKKENLELHYKLSNLFNYDLNKRKYALLNQYEKLEKVFNNKVILLKQDLNESIIKLNLLDPKNVLDKGYSILKYNNMIVKDYSTLKQNDLVEVFNNNYIISAIIKEVKKNG